MFALCITLEPFSRICSVLLGTRPRARILAGWTLAAEGVERLDPPIRSSNYRVMLLPESTDYYHQTLAL